MTDAPPTRTPGRAWPLVLLGLVALGGLGYGAAALLIDEPAVIEIPAQRVVGEQAVRQVEPISPEDPTPFLAALPTTAKLWSLTEVRTHDPEAVEDSVGRVAEAHTLVYDDGDDVVMLHAFQMYAEDKARGVVSGQPTDVEVADHAVLGTPVGIEARRSNATQTRVMWSNGAAYFEALGPTEVIDAFVEGVGL